MVRPLSHLTEEGKDGKVINTERGCGDTADVGCLFKYSAEPEEIDDSLYQGWV